MEQEFFALLTKLLEEGTEAEIQDFIAELPPGFLDNLLTQGNYTVDLPDTPEGFETYFKLMHGSPLHTPGKQWVQDLYLDHEDGRGSALECFMESGKTTVVSKFFASWRIGHEPHKVSGIIRINDTKAQETAEAIARLIEYDPRWKKCFPNVVPDKGRGWGAEKGYYVKDGSLSDEAWQVKMTAPRPDGPTFIGRGIENGAIIGSRYNGFLIVDDIHDDKNTASPKQIQAIIEFYKKTLSSRPMRGCWRIWNFTPWTYNDTYAYIKSTGTFRAHKTPAITPAAPQAEGAQFWPPTPLNPDYPELGQIPHSGQWWYLAVPEMWDFERLSGRFRDGKVLGFAQTMLLDLEATKGIYLKGEWLHEYPASEIKASWPVVIGVDYASTPDKLKTPDRDYFALAVLRAIPGGGLVLIDGYRAKISKGEALDAVAAYAGLYPTLQKIGVESIGKGEEFYNDLVFTNDANGKVLPLFKIQHGRTSKGDRFENWLAPRFKIARLWIADALTPFLEAFRNEWLTFPNGENDDCLDAVYMAAFAGEGFLPNKAERTSGAQTLLPQLSDPYMAFARS